jgi:hypothetical protein
MKRIATRSLACGFRACAKAERGPRSPDGDRVETRFCFCRRAPTAHQSAVRYFQAPADGVPVVDQDRVAQAGWQGPVRRPARAGSGRFSRVMRRLTMPSWVRTRTRPTTVGFARHSRTEYRYLPPRHCPWFLHGHASGLHFRMECQGFKSATRVRGASVRSSGATALQIRRRISRGVPSPAVLAENSPAVQESLAQRIGTLGPIASSALLPDTVLFSYLRSKTPLAFLHRATLRTLASGRGKNGCVLRSYS